MTSVEPAAAKAAARKWVTSQTNLISKFGVGDAVTRRAGHWSHGVIIEIVPYNMVEFTDFIGENQPPIMPASWGPGSDAQARVAWAYSGTRKMAPKETWVSLKRLRLGE